MPIAVYIDNNVWDFLYEKKIDLSSELRRPEFCICITREAEFEIPPIPDEKIKLKNYISNTISKCMAETHMYFGYYDDRHSENEQRFGGYGQGVYATEEELNFIRTQRTKIGSIKNPKTGLYKNEADVSVAARSFNSIVLTLDAKKGPLNNAYKQGGQVVFLTEFEFSGLSLKEFILQKCS